MVECAKGKNSRGDIECRTPPAREEKAGLCGHQEDLIVPYNKKIVGFTHDWVNILGYVDIRTRHGIGHDGKELTVRYFLVEANTSYNVLIGRPWMNAFDAIISMPHLAMKFPFDRGTICTIHTDQRTAWECYVVRLKVEPYVPPRKLGD